MSGLVLSIQNSEGEGNVIFRLLAVFISSAGLIGRPGKIVRRKPSA
jgi:hypothetical protein